MNKKLVIGGIAVVAVAVASVAVLCTGMDAIVKKAIVRYGSEATQTAVNVTGVNISLKNGEASLRDLTVGNPAGFSSGNALSLGGISVRLDTHSVTGTGPIVIEDITVDKPLVAFEVNAAGESNLRTIGNNAQNAGGQAQEAPAAAPGAAPARKVIIKKLTIRDGAIAINSPLLKGKKLSADLPEIRLSNIGGKHGGASPAEVAGLIISTLSSAASSVALPNLTKEIGNIKDAAGEAAKGITGGVAGGVVDGATDAAGAAGSALKGVLGGK